MLPSMFQSFVNGSIAGTAEVFINQPLASIKCEMQKMQEKSRPSLVQMVRRLNWRLLYSGAGVNATSMAAVTGVQIMARDFFNSWFSDGALPLTDTQKALSSVLSGASGALFACPGELLMDRKREMTKLFEKGQLIKRPSYLETLRDLMRTRGVLSPYRGFWHTAFRDTGFAFSYQVGAKYVSSAIEPYTGAGVVNTLLGGITAGTVGAVITHPLDTRKTQVQSWTEESFFKSSMKETLVDSMKGFGPRSLRVISAVCVLSGVIDALEKLTLSDTK